MQTTITCSTSACNSIHAKYIWYMPSLTNDQEIFLNKLNIVLKIKLKDVKMLTLNLKVQIEYCLKQN